MSQSVTFSLGQVAHRRYKIGYAPCWIGRNNDQRDPMRKTDDMTEKDDTAKPIGNARFDQHIQQQLSEIQNEDTPERLLVLARELQRLLKAADK